MRRYAPLVLIACLCAARAVAQFPTATINRIVTLNLQEQEVKTRRTYAEIDSRAASELLRPIEAERKDLYRQLGNLSREERRQVDNQIEALTKMRLATLQPQWDAQAKKFQQQQADHDRAVTDAMREDVKRGVELQHQRLLLQQQRDRGQIGAAEFASEDKKFLDQIMALRGRYAREGEKYAARFDNDLRNKTSVMAQNELQPVPTKVPTMRPAPPTPIQPVRPQNPAPYVWPLLDVVVWLTVTAVLAAFGWRSRKQGKPRPSPARLAFGAVGLFLLCWLTAPDSVPPQAATADILAILGWWALKVLAVVGGLYLLGKLLQRRPTAPRPVSTVHGSAHYAPLREDVDDETCLTNGIFFGKSSTPDLKEAPLGVPGAPVCTTPERHTLIVAQTRTGKGTRVIIPTLLRYGGSALVIDPKGENAAITARIRRDQLNQDVFILNPWNALPQAFQQRGLARATYNPLDILDRNDPNAVAIARTIATTICPAPEDSKDYFWQGNAAGVLTAVLLWVADQPGETKTLARVRQIVTLRPEVFTKHILMPMAASEGFSGAIREFAGPFVKMAADTFSGIMGNVNVTTTFLSDPQIKTATEKSSFSMEKLARGKATVYVVIPPQRMSTQRTWLRLVIASAMHIFKNAEGKLPYGHRCLFLIDEFAALGRIDDFPVDITTMAGYGVDFALVIQGLEQLKHHYGEARGDILGNCAYKWFCNAIDPESVRYLCETLGKATVETTSTSDSFSSGGQSSSHSHSTSHGETGRPLLTENEIIHLGKDVAIGLQPNGYPLYLRPVDYWKLPEAFASLREKYPKLYWQPPLAYDDHPYFSAPPPPGGGARANGSGGNGSRGNGQQQGRQTYQRRQPMTAKEAREILEVAENASREEILKAYRRLMGQVHPDHGGTNHFARELNEAKEVLLGE